MAGRCGGMVTSVAAVLIGLRSRRAFWECGRIISALCSQSIRAGACRSCAGMGVEVASLPVDGRDHVCLIHGRIG